MKIIIKAKILLCKTLEGNGTLKVRVRVKFLLLYSKLAATDPWCNMLRDFTRMENI